MDILRRGLAALAITLALTGSTLAQGWPNKPIRWIVPYTPGGYTDLMSRLVGQKVADALGVTVVFENKPGANAIIGTDAVVKAAPDGYTFGTVIAAHSVNVTLNPKLPYDTMKDITYVSLMSSAPLIIIANKSLPANNIQELIALAKSKPGSLSFASSGVGAAAHLTMEMFKARLGLDMVHVPYKGTAGALQDTVAGNINVMFDIVGPLMPQVTAGNVKALGLAAKEPIPAAPGVKDHHRAGRDGLRFGHLGRHHRACRRAEGDRRARVCGSQESARGSRHESKARRSGDCPDRQHAGGIPRLPRRRDRALGQGHQGREHQGGGVAVIPGRTEGAYPGSITTTLSVSHGRCLWIPVLATLGRDDRG